MPKIRHSEARAAAECCVLLPAGAAWLVKNRCNISLSYLVAMGLAIICFDNTSSC